MQVTQCVIILIYSYFFSITGNLSKVKYYIIWKIPIFLDGFLKQNYAVCPVKKMPYMPTPVNQLQKKKLPSAFNLFWFSLL